MKVGILTITEGANYGNRLQNFAMQELLKSLGAEVETVRRETPSNEIKETLHSTAEYVKKMLGGKYTSYLAGKRKKRFDKFNDAYINFSKESLPGDRALTEQGNGYDYFVCGSDQIWNTRFDIVAGEIRNYLAAFAEPSKRIAFAASFGTDQVEPAYELLFREELKKFKAIAVRETAGKEIAEKLTGRKDVQVVLDPTLLLEKEKWEELEKKPAYVGDKKIIATYFLGGRSPETKRYIDRLAQENRADVIDLDNEFLFDREIENADFFETNPAEFVWLIHHAECVLTDSFHASAFSVIFQKPFLVFDRDGTAKNNMNSRITTLLGRFGLEACKGDITDPAKVPEEYDPAKVDAVLRSEREKGMRFLKQALENPN